MTAPTAVRVSHYSDVLCVWAYVGQIRFDELATNFGSQIELDYRYFPVFGATHEKLRGWADRGGVAGFAMHVRSVVDKFGHVEMNDRIWTEVTPTSSVPAHLFLRAVGLVDPAAVPRAADAVRAAFFVRARDISRRSELFEIAEHIDVSRAEIEARIDDGSAHAALNLDGASADTQGIRISPTAVFNEGRQRLTGNVGYRVLEANIRELLGQPEQKGSWC